jgi:hypothetical protein
MTKSELLALGGLQTRTGTSLREIGLAALEAAEAKGREQETQPAPPMPRKRYVVGIDPGVKTGFAVWDRKEKQFVSVETRDFWGVMIPLILDTENLLPDVAIRNTTAEIVVEVAHHAPVFRERKTKGLNENHAARLAQNVGQVMREAKLLAEGLRRCGYEVIEQKPLGKKGKAADDRAEFERVTGWTKQTSQHARDAARMAFQR